MHSAEKCKRETLLDLLTYIPLQNIKNLEGGAFGDIKTFRKKSHSAETNPKGDPLGTSGFVGFLEKVKKEWRPFGLSLPWPDLVLVVLVNSVKSVLKPISVRSVV